LVLFHVIQPAVIVGAGEDGVPSTRTLITERRRRASAGGYLEPVIVEANEVGAAYIRTSRADEKRRTAAEDYLNSVRKTLNRKRLKVSSTVVQGSPPDQTIDYAKANAIDLIAMSSHGRTGIGRWVFGSVTDKVLHAGDTPVLVVRATKA